MMPTVRWARMWTHWLWPPKLYSGAAKMFRRPPIDSKIPRTAIDCMSTVWKNPKGRSCL